MAGRPSTEEIHQEPVGAVSRFGRPPAEGFREHRFQVAGVGVDVLTQRRLLESLDRVTSRRQRCRVVFCNTSSVVEANHRPALREAINAAEIVSPDGMPLVWLGKLRGKRPVMERVDGPTFMKEAMQYGVTRGWRHYLYGSTPEVLEALKTRLQDEVKGVQIVGAASPAFGDQTSHQVSFDLEQINASKPDLVWIGLGMPKQELWMARHFEDTSAPVLLGVGAAFDFQAGVKPRAPLWMQRAGMEWLHRLMQEPRRLWRRYLIGNAEFGLLVVRAQLSSLGTR